MKKYEIDFEFQTDDPPDVFIADENGYQVLRVLENSIPRTPEFSWNSEDWEPGPFAKKLVNLLNSDS